MDNEIASREGLLMRTQEKSALSAGKATGRSLLKSAMLTMAAASITTTAAFAQQAEHFDKRGKMPSDSTVQVLDEARKTLPFSDKQDFEEAKRGLITEPETLQIKSENDGLAWDMERFNFIVDGKDFKSIHPSLERQAKLTTQFGLYKVKDGIYQVRGYDLSNLTLVSGDTGWIVFDT